MGTITKKPATSKLIAEYLLEIGAVKFNVENPFTWVSGIRSPIYCDNRIINSKVKVRKAVIDEFTKIISEYYLQDINTIAGVATGGIPYGVLTADRLDLPFIYVREKRKEHGLKKIVEGEFSAGDKVVLIEDHISTGISSRKAVQGLREEGLVLVSLISIMTYGFAEADKQFKEENIEHASLCDLDTVLEVAQKNGRLSNADVKTILDFRESPATWKSV